MRWPVPAWAHHGEALGDASSGPLASALTFVGLALLVAAIVVVLIAVLNRRPGPPDRGK